jgi:hypothetical protein
MSAIPLLSNGQHSSTDLRENLERTLRERDELCSRIDRRGSVLLSAWCVLCPVNCVAAYLWTAISGSNNDQCWGPPPPPRNWCDLITSHLHPHPPLEREQRSLPFERQELLALNRRIASCTMALGRGQFIERVILIERVIREPKIGDLIQSYLQDPLESVHEELLRRRPLQQ